MRDAQGITGRKVEIYSLPYKNINMWSTENAGTIDMTAEVDQATPGTFWLATQTITDPEGNMDWRIAALVDLAASDKEKRVVLTVLTVDAR